VVKVKAFTAITWLAIAGALVGCSEVDTAENTGSNDSPTSGPQNAPPPANNPPPNTPPVLAGTPGASVQVGTRYSFVPQAVDADGDTLAFSVTGLPRWAVFSATTGELSGTPGAADVGETADIIIAASDGRASAVIGPFRIRVVSLAPPATNTPPVISGSPSAVATVGVVYSFQPTASDRDGDALSFAIANRPAWLSFNATSGQLSGTPAATDVGTFANIVITVSDGRLSTSLPALTIRVQTPSATTPTIAGTPSGSAVVGTRYAFRPSASDPNGDALTFSIQNRPTWATFSTATGELAGTPAASDVGVHDGIVIGVSDGRDSVALPAFAITVTTTANRPPVISGQPATTIESGANYSFSPTASDPDNNPLTFTIQNRPAWAAFNPQTGQLSGTPAAANVGTYSNILIGVNDGTVSASLPAFAIRVTSPPNRAPTISGQPPTTVAAGVAYSFRPTAADPDGDALTFSIQNRPAWATFNTQTGELSGTPTQAGTFANIEISVSDGNATAGLPIFTITVNTAPTAGRVILAWDAPTTNADGSALTNLAGYRIVYGRSSGSLNQVVEITSAGATRYQFDNLAAGAWFFAIRSYTSAGVESVLSPVLSTTVQ
jgi:hypothetical protein